MSDQMRFFNYAITFSVVCHLIALVMP